MNPNLEKLPKGWPAILAKEYEEGATDVEVRAKLRMTKGVWDSLYSDTVNTQFRELVEFGHDSAKSWWMGTGRSNLFNKNFNANLFLMFMKNCHGWSDKSTIVTKDVEDLSDDELNARIKELNRKVEKLGL